MRAHMHASHTCAGAHAHSHALACPHALTHTSHSDRAVPWPLAAFQHSSGLGEPQWLCHPGPWAEVAERALEPCRAPRCPPLGAAVAVQSGWVANGQGQPGLGQGGPGTCGVSGCDAGALAGSLGPLVSGLASSPPSRGLPSPFVGLPSPSSVPEPHSCWATWEDGGTSQVAEGSLPACPPACPHTCLLSNTTRPAPGPRAARAAPGGQLPPVTTAEPRAAVSQAASRVSSVLTY